MEIHWRVLEQRVRGQPKKMPTNKDKSTPEEEMKTEGERCDLSWPGKTRNAIRFVRIKRRDSVYLCKFLRSSAPPLLMGYFLTEVERKKKERKKKKGRKKKEGCD